jgi:biotin carboxyl carrier protein
MQLTVTIAAQDHPLQLASQRERSTTSEPPQFALDGVPFHAEVAQIGPGLYSILIGSKSFEVHVTRREAATGEYLMAINGRTITVSIRDPRRSRRGVHAGLAADGKQKVVALMPGKVVRVLVVEGEAVTSGQGLVVIEAMKMQNEIKARSAGTVQRVLVSEGQPVNAGDLLLRIE